MSPYTVTLLIILAYKLVAIIVGLLLALMGYKLFSRGLSQEAGDMDLKLPGVRGLRLRRAAPGVFFVVLGAMVIIVGLFKGLEVTVSGKRISTADLLPCLERSSPGQPPQPGVPGPQDFDIKSRPAQLPKPRL